MVRRQILEGPQPEDLSLSKKRRRAALAKWQKRKDAVTDPGATDTVADSGCRELVAVPAADARESRLVPYVHGYEPSSMSCTGQLERHLDLWNSVPKTKNSSLERFLVETATQTYVPKKLVAARHGKSGQTVRRRLRILAFVVVIARRFRSNRWLEELYSHLVDSFGVQTVVPLSWCVKYKYDELSLRVASKETSGSATDESKITKLLQVTCWWLAVFKLNLDSGVKYVRTQLRSPTTLRAIEKSSGSCTKRALERQVLIPRSVPNLFADRTRMPIADQHVANEAADLALWAADAGTSLDKYTCRAHVQHRIGELIGATQPSEARGILYISLSLNFSGKVALFKANLKSYITAKLKIYEYGYEGSGQAATEHREHVFRQYLVTEDARERCTGTRGEARLKKYHTTKRLWNGRYKNTQVIEHFCLGLGRCCNNRGQTLAHFHDWVDRYDLPALFCRSRWLGIEQAVDACGFLLMAHDVFSPVFRQTFAESQKPTANPPLALLDRDGDNDGDKEEIDNEDDGEVLIDGELNLPQPEKDSTQDVRQATYRANGMTFVNDCPHGRVWMFRSAIRLQQNSQKSLIRNSGKTFQRAELLRRAKGKSPCYIPLMACEGFFTNTSMIDFCATVMEAKHHSAIPAEYRTHELAVASCRMGLAGSAATYQLMLRPAGDNFGFKLLKRGTVAQRLCAIELVERYLHRPCTLRPFWYDHVKLHKADVDSLCGEDSLQKLEAHADFVEIENVSTEALNSTIRRFVARCVQQKILNLEDLSAQWALQQEKSDITGVWGIDKSVVLDPMDKDTKRTAKPQTGGGGGRCRAFVSRLSQMPEYKHSNGRVCFAKIMQKWKDEQENPTELSHGLDEQGKLATRARRQQVHKDAEQSKWDISAFGRLRPQTTEVATKKLEIDVKIDALESAAQQHVEDSQQLLALVAVHTNIHKSLLEAHDTGDLGQQLRAIHQLCRALAIRESRRDRLEEKEARAKLQEAELCEGVDLSKFRDEKKGSGVIVFKGTECVEVRPVLNVFKWSTERVAEMNEKKQGFGPMAQKLWQEEHVLERDTGDKLDPLPKGFAQPAGRKSRVTTVGIALHGEGFSEEIRSRANAATFEDNRWENALKFFKKAPDWNDETARQVLMEGSRFFGIWDDSCLVALVRHVMERQPKVSPALENWIASWSSTIGEPSLEACGSNNLKKFQTQTAVEPQKKEKGWTSSFVPQSSLFRMYVALGSFVTIICLLYAYKVVWISYPGILELFSWPIFIARAGGMGCTLLTALLYSTMSRSLYKRIYEMRQFGTRLGLVMDAHKDLHIFTGYGMFVSSAIHIAGHLMGTVPGIIHAEPEELNAIIGCANPPDDYIRWTGPMLVWPNCPIEKRLTYWEVCFMSTIGLSGIVLTVLLIVVGWTACMDGRFGRKENFDLFMNIHNFTIVSWPILCFIHGSNGWVGVGFPLVVLASGVPILCYSVDRVARLVRYYRYSGTVAIRHAVVRPCRKEGDRPLAYISVSKPSGLWHFWPGTYAFICMPEYAPLQWHPFTIKAAVMVWLIDNS